MEPTAAAAALSALIQLFMSSRNELDNVTSVKAMASKIQGPNTISNSPPNYHQEFLYKFHITTVHLLVTTPIAQPIDPMKHNTKCSLLHLFVASLSWRISFKRNSKNI